MTRFGGIFKSRSTTSVLFPTTVRMALGAKTRIQAMVQNIDYAPTFLDIAGAPIPDEVQGRSLLPLLGGKVPADWRDAIYYHDYMDGAYNLPRFEGVRTERYKLINYLLPVNTCLPSSSHDVCTAMDGCFAPKATINGRTEARVIW